MITLGTVTIEPAQRPARAPSPARLRALCEAALQHLVAEWAPRGARSLWAWFSDATQKQPLVVRGLTLEVTPCSAAEVPADIAWFDRPPLSPLGRCLRLDITAGAEAEASSTPGAAAPARAGKRRNAARWRRTAWLSVERYYPLEGIERLLSAMTVETANPRGLVLASDVPPPGRVRRAHILDAAHGATLAVCGNAGCLSRGAPRLVSTRAYPAALGGRVPSMLPVLPCPSCVGDPTQAWALDMLRPATSFRDAAEAIEYDVPSVLRRPLGFRGPLTLIAGGRAASLWGAVWAPSQVVRLPRWTARIGPGTRVEQMFDVLCAHGPVAGSTAAVYLTPDNVRALVEYARGQPLARRIAAAEAWASVLQPRRRAVYRTAHDDSGDHYPYIALTIKTFINQLAFLGVMDDDRAFLDVGSGVGEKPWVAYATCQFSRCDGIEFNADTLAVGRYLLAGLGSAAEYPIRLMQGDAFEFDRYQDYQVLYMYRPLRDRPRMGVLLRRILERMAVGAIVLDGIDARIAVRRDAEDRWSTYDPERTERAQWTVPITIDAFLDSVDLGPA